MFRHNSSQTNIQASRTTWDKTKHMLESLTLEEIQEAARLAEAYKPISNSKVKELLKLINKIGGTATGSDQKKSYMLVQLKSSMVYFGCPLIFITFNPGERHSPISLYYAGEKVDLKSFDSTLYSTSDRFKIMLQNPLAVVEYFHSMIKVIIEKVLQGGLFGGLRHHYGTIEYQGRYIPYIYMAVSIAVQTILTLLVMDQRYNYAG